MKEPYSTLRDLYVRQDNCGEAIELLGEIINQGYGNYNKNRCIMLRLYTIYKHLSKKIENSTNLL